MADRLTGMQTFVQVVESGSFAGAASRLAISLQQVGKEVAAIEQRLGTRLLNRSTWRQSLTKAGQLFSKVVVERWRRLGKCVENVKPDGQLVINDSRAVIQAALQGFGIIVMADPLVAEHLATGRLIRVLPNFPGPSSPMHLLTSAKTAQAPKLRAFLNWAGTVFDASGA